MIPGNTLRINTCYLWAVSVLALLSRYLLYLGRSFPTLRAHRNAHRGMGLVTPTYDSSRNLFPLNCPTLIPFHSLEAIFHSDNSLTCETSPLPHHFLQACVSPRWRVHVVNHICHRSTTANGTCVFLQTPAEEQAPTCCVSSWLEPHCLFLDRRPPPPLSVFCTSHPSMQAPLCSPVSPEAFRLSHTLTLSSFPLHPQVHKLVRFS